jgi:hypothetical protein
LELGVAQFLSLQFNVRIGVGKLHEFSLPQHRKDAPPMAMPSLNTKKLSHLPSPSKTLLSKQAMKDYVYFSDNTKGINGKVVKIKIDLFLRFAALVDPKTHTGQTIIRQIENLRMLNAASPGVHANTHSAFRFMLQLSNMQVFYAVLDGDNESGKAIFIGDIKADFKNNNDKAGLYVFDTLTDRYSRFKQTNLDGKVVYVNGQCGNLKDAGIAANKRVEISIDRLALFFTPGDVINELGIWSSSSVAEKMNESIGQLRNVMKFNQDKKVHWVAEAEGAEVFSSALDGINGVLSGHKFRLIDPLANTPLLLQKLKTKEIKPTTDEVAPVTYTGENRATNMFMESHKHAVINALKMLSAKSYAEYPHQNMVKELEATAGNKPAEKNKQALTNTAALNQRVMPTKAVVTDNKAALSFITALKRV